jgi:hypothetical protein
VRPNSIRAFRSGAEEVLFVVFSNLRPFSFVPLLALAITGLVPNPASARLRGAIFTTNATGTAVNQNHFALKEAVYLGGGPQHLGGGPRLPEGEYYFQVTDSSGRTLLSSDDAACRQLFVDSTGRISGVIPASGCEHALGGNPNPGDPSPNGTRPVQMFPFDDSPNRGGVYKVWLIAQSSAVSGCDPAVDGDGKHLSFPRRCAKSDNFKVDFQTRPACAAWHDDFDQGALDLTRWVVVSGPAPGSAPTNIGTFDPAHVSLAGGLLTLTLTQQQGADSVWLSTGALVHTQVPCGYGTYEWTMRMSSSTNGPSSTGTNVSGAVSAGFTYINNSEHEIAIEHSAASPESIWFVNFHNQDPLNRDPLPSEETNTQHPLPDVYNEFHHYKFVWQPGSITFYIDGQEITEHTTNVPTAPAYFMMTHFGRDFALWGGPATAGTRYFFVRRAAFTPLN